MKLNTIDQLRRISQEIGKSKTLIEKAKQKLSRKEIENSKIMKLGEQLEIVSQKLFYDQENVQKLSLNLIPSVEFDLTIPDISRLQSNEEISQEMKIAKVESMKFPNLTQQIEQSLKQTRHSEILSQQEEIKSNEENNQKKSTQKISKTQVRSYFLNKYHYFEKEQDRKNQDKLSLIKFDD